MNRLELKAWIQGYLDEKLSPEEIEKICGKIDECILIDFGPIEPMPLYPTPNPYPYPWNPVYGTHETSKSLDNDDYLVYDSLNKGGFYNEKI